jgi:uncharacterized protein (DUF427 family)
MNWKPKKGIGKTLYAIDLYNISFNSDSIYSIWANDVNYPLVTKYKQVMIITNGVTSGSTFIIAKKDKDKEYRTYKLKKISTINEEKQGVVIFKGQNILMSNSKKELITLMAALYKQKEKLARKCIDEFNKGTYCGTYYGDSEYFHIKVMQQPQCVMKSYKNFVDYFKKL